MAQVGKFNFEVPESGVNIQLRPRPPYEGQGSDDSFLVGVPSFDQSQIPSDFPLTRTSSSCKLQNN